MNGWSKKTNIQNLWLLLLLVWFTNYIEIISQMCLNVLLNSWTVQKMTICMDMFTKKYLKKQHKKQHILYIYIYIYIYILMFDLWPLLTPCLCRIYKYFMKSEIGLVRVIYVDFEWKFTCHKSQLANVRPIFVELIKKLHWAMQWCE